MSLKIRELTSLVTMLNEENEQLAGEIHTLKESHENTKAVVKECQQRLNDFGAKKFVDAHTMV